MSCDRNNPCRPDPIREEARAIADMMDSGRQTGQVADALRNDSYNMRPGEFNRMVGMIRNEYDRRNQGDDLIIRNDGALILDTGRDQVLVSTRMLEERQARMADHSRDPRYRDVPQQGYPAQVYGPQGERRPNTAVEDLGKNVIIGAGVGGVMSGRKGAAGGAAAGAAETVIDHTGGINTGNQVLDTVAKGAIGYGVGRVVGGNDGGRAGAVTSILGDLLNKNNR